MNDEFNPIEFRAFWRWMENPKLGGIEEKRKILLTHMVLQQKQWERAEMGRDIYRQP